MKKCKEIEENNRKGKNQRSVQVIGDIKGIFWAKMDMIKDKNCTDLTEGEELEAELLTCAELWRKPEFQKKHLLLLHWLRKSL